MPKFHTRRPGKTPRIVLEKDAKNPYFRYVKSFVLAIAIFLTTDVTAQVIFRNDIVINRKEKKLFNLGITTVSINLSRHPNWNQLINGRGGRTMVIDVRSLRHREVIYYSYYDMAERIYVPASFAPPVTQPLPAFLLIGRKSNQYPFAVYDGLGLMEKPVLKFHH